MPGSPGHLFSRFFDVATARRLEVLEEATVETWLTPELVEVFFQQDAPDQRHGYEAALSVLASGVRDSDVITAALVHDIGKRHARLGLIGRSVSSVLILAGLPLTKRMTTYRDHGLVAARELGALGAPSLVIDFALHHHGERPPTILPTTWELLVAADQPPKTWPALRGRITSSKP